MNTSPYAKPPYFDWRLDRWKIAVLLLLLTLLVIGALFWPDDVLALFGTLFLHMGAP